MFDLRFVEREVPAWPREIVIGEPCGMKTIKILQWRQMSYNKEQDLVWGEWEDVRLEKEPISE